MSNRDLTQRTTALRVTDSPVVWVATGAAFTFWFRRNPQSRLFWFVAGVGTALWALKTVTVEWDWNFAQWRRRAQARRQSLAKERVRECLGLDIDELTSTVEALRNEVSELRREKEKPTGDHDQLSEPEHIVFEAAPTEGENAFTFS